MDPLSVVASVTGLISFCVDVSNYLSDVKNAPKTAERLYAQVSSLQQVLKQLEDFLKANPNRRFAKTSALVKSTEVCKRELLEVLAKLQEVSKSKFQRITFPWNEKEINKSIDVLRGCTQTFHFSLTIDGWYVCPFYD